MIAEILNSLYRGSTSNVYAILNKSIYITDIENKQDACLFHTGFGFKSHKGKMFYLYYDLKSSSIIRSSESTNPLYGKIPQLLGLICFLNGYDYIQNFSTDLFTSFVLSKAINNNDEFELKGLEGIDSFGRGEILEPSHLQEKNKSVTLVNANGSEQVAHEYFEISDGCQIINRFPLYKMFTDIVFVNSFSFAKYDPALYTKEERQSIEDWYRSEFGDAANDAWWNTH